MELLIGRPYQDVQEFTVRRSSHFFSRRLKICLFANVGIGLLLFLVSWKLSFGWLGITLLILTLLANRVKEESVMVIEGLGVQLRRTYYTGAEIHKFIDQGKIKDIVINEGVTMCRVIFYLAFMVEDSDQMILAFEGLFPRLDMLHVVYRGTRAMIYGDGEAPANDGPLGPAMASE